MTKKLLFRPDRSLAQVRRDAIRLRPGTAPAEAPVNTGFVEVVCRIGYTEPGVRTRRV
jgi:hypothetical protein